MWTAGNQPNPILESLPCERNRAGAVVAESTLQVPGFANIWAVGGCAQIPDPANEGEFYPPTAQYAIGEGKQPSKNIAATLREKPLKEFRFRTLGLMVPLGHSTGAADIRGLLAWLMWRMTYLTLLPGLEKKVRVTFDWFLNFCFPRDIVQTADSAPCNDSTEQEAAE